MGSKRYDMPIGDRKFREVGNIKHALYGIIKFDCNWSLKW